MAWANRRVIAPQQLGHNVKSRFQHRTDGRNLGGLVGYEVNKHCNFRCENMKVWPLNAKPSDDLTSWKQLPNHELTIYGTPGTICCIAQLQRPGFAAKLAGPIPAPSPASAA